MKVLYLNHRGCFLYRSSVSETGSCELVIPCVAVLHIAEAKLGSFLQRGKDNYP